MTRPPTHKIRPNVRFVPIVLQKSFCATPRERAENAIPGNGLMVNKDSWNES